MIDISFKTYEVQLWLEDEEGDWCWDTKGGSYLAYANAFEWYEIYKAGGHQVRIVETQCVKSWKNGVEYG